MRDRSDEAHYHLDGVVNKQNVPFWAPENPRGIHEKVHHALRITVWAAILSHGLQGPIFFEEPMNRECYLSMLCSTFVPHLSTGLPLQTRWFMQDGARLHTVNVVMDFLHDTFNLYVISNRFPDHFRCGQNLLPNSPDLNPYDYFLWGFLKEKIFPQNTQTITELRALIILACNEVTEDMYC
jgi:hypothetical protein